MSKLIDHSRYMDYVYIGGEQQKFPSSSIRDERFDKLKQRQEEYKRKMLFKQEFPADKFINDDLPIDPRGISDRPTRESKLGGFINVPPTIQAQPIHFGKQKVNTNDINKIVDYIHEYDKFDVKADHARETINEKINDVSDVQCKYSGLGMFSQHFKSTGYPSTFEHNFNYISNNMQLPEHSCEERGFPSRSLNKSVNKKREVMQ